MPRADKIEVIRDQPTLLRNGAKTNSLAQISLAHGQAFSGVFSAATQPPLR